TLPNEVLAAILKQVADLPVTSQETLYPFPIVASHVSQHWRDMSLAFPELWSRIRISRHPRSLELAELFVERSG
ncbi:hypothetical protein C8J57DRAFT_973196, partial [Mycena rebaudengoi]